MKLYLYVAAVILGGGEFVGGWVSPIGVVLGALTLALAASLLTFLHVPSDWQIGMQGMILIVVFALHAGIGLLSRERAAHEKGDGLARALRLRRGGARLGDHGGARGGVVAAVAVLRHSSCG